MSINSENEQMNKITVSDALKLIKNFAQSCRENGEADMRSILNFVRALQRDYDAGMTRNEILDLYVPEDTDVN